MDWSAGKGHLTNIAGNVSSISSQEKDLLILFQGVCSHTIRDKGTSAIHQLEASWLPGFYTINIFSINVLLGCTIIYRVVEIK